MTERQETRAQDAAVQDEVVPADVGRAATWELRGRDLGRTAAVTVLSVVAALVIGALAVALSDPDVLDAASYVFDRADAVRLAGEAVTDAYGALLRGSVGSPRALSETVVAATPLILAGLGVALAFRAGLFNIGAEGQLLVGGLAAGAVGFGFDLPVVVHVVAAVLAGAVGGAAWGAVPGWLKARTGAHEVITTIMMNWISFNLALLVLKSAWVRREGRTDPISRVVAALAVAWLLRRSTTGFEFRAVGLNEAAARTAGMSVEGTWTLAMVLSGGLAGLAGAAQVLGIQHSLAPGFSAGIGFDAITVALLGRATPVGTVLAGLLFGALRAGGLSMQAATGTPVDLVVVIQALIILFVAAPALVRAIFRIRAATEADRTLSKGWSG